MGDTNEILIRWAEDQFNLIEVTHVTFEALANAYGYCETCGPDPPCIEVGVQHSGGYFSTERYQTTDLINEILSYA